MNVRKTRVAILSFAHPHSESYATILRDREDIEVVGVDPAPHDGGSRSRGADLSTKLGVKFLDDYSSAMAWKPDAVVVTAETSHHAQLVRMAATAGAHVLCEKPLATTLEDALSMQKAVDDAGVLLMTAYPTRFSPSFRALKSRVDSGELGDILCVLGVNNGKKPGGDVPWFTDPQLAGGGALPDHIVHCADLIDDLLGVRAISVHAVANSLLAPDLSVESAGLVTVVYEDGTIATIDCSWSCAPTSPAWGGLSLQVAGSRGTITINPFSQHVSGYDSSGAVWESTGTNLDALMLDEFLSAIAELRQPHPDGHSGQRTLEIVVAAQRSVELGSRVHI